MKILRFALAGLLTGFILALLADRSVWVEMRINSGLLLPISTGMAAIAGIISGRRMPAVIILGLETLLMLVLLLDYGFAISALLIIPASIFREGFFLGNSTLGAVNDILVGLLVMGNGLFLVPAVSRVKDGETGRWKENS
jgi:hypothetical protein